MKKNKKAVFIGVGVLLLFILGFGYYKYNQIHTAKNLFKPTNLVQNSEELGNEQEKANTQKEENAQEENAAVDPEEEENRKIAQGIANNFNGNVINVLLMGFDRTLQRDKIYSIYRTDTLILVSINFDTKEVSMVSVPRDSYVKIAHRNGGMDKINHSFYYGHQFGKGKNPRQNGIQYTIDTVSSLLNDVPIHYYVGFDMDGAMKIVDILGGIRVNVEEDIKADYGKGRLLVPKGDRVLTGKEFVYYAIIRQRDPSSDTGRVKRQQEIMKMVFDKFKSSNLLVTVPQIYQTMSDAIDTNMNLEQMTALALFANKIDADKIAAYQLAGEYKWLNKPNKSVYMIVDQDKKNEIVSEVFGQ